MPEAHVIDAGERHSTDVELTLFQLLDPAVHANPYPFYRRLQEAAPVHWDPFMQTWVVTRYDDVQTVLLRFSAERTPDPEKMRALGLPDLTSLAGMMTRQMLFQDAPDHTRLRKLCLTAFTPRRVEALEHQIAKVAEGLIDKVIASGAMDVIADFAEPFPAIVTAGLLGVPLDDHRQLKSWSADFAEMLGNFQHNPGRVREILRTVDAMTDYFRDEVRAQVRNPRDGLIARLIAAESDGSRLTEDEIIANNLPDLAGQEMNVRLAFDHTGTGDQRERSATWHGSTNAAKYPFGATAPGRWPQRKMRTTDGGPKAST